LIHAGAGGVGLAAIQLAQQAGATVFATAGTVEKRQFLKQLGVEYVFDSRSIAFAEEVLHATGSAGVDIVLNSLSGDFLDASLATLGRYGRFVEIGKRDIYENRPLALGPFRKNLSFFAVDLAAMLEERPDQIADLLRKLLAEFQHGSLKPSPVRVFPASQAAEMLRCMANAQHIGRLALTFDEPEVMVRPALPGRVDFRPDGGYLLTGGLGGIGMLVARWMVEHGARHLVLVGRRAPSEQAQRAIREMEAHGAIVRTIAADVSKPQEVKRILASFEDGFPALRGVLHAAAVVDDALVVNIDPARLEQVMGPKAFGAWNLHRQTAHQELDFFVMFSSIAAVLPQPGHGSYAAANAFLDALARHRRSLGKPGLSVNWGGWSGTGLAITAGASSTIRGYAARGMKPLSSRQGLDALGHLLGRTEAVALAVPVDWRKLAASYRTEGVPVVLSNLAQQQSQSASSETWKDDPVGQIRTAPAGQRRELLENHLRSELARVLRLAPARIERNNRLGSMGLDSLMAVTFVRRLSASLGILLPATAAFNYPTIATLATHVALKLGVELDTDPETKPSAPAERTPVSHDVEALSDEQAIEALLANGVKA
jgi:NADPH:quinone reductase-like Zn-dependent oxidoreductase/acyl carrier protein